jgi:hypothetical protein
VALAPLELGKLGLGKNTWEARRRALADDFQTAVILKVFKRRLARPERFELPTYSSGGCRSIQLSYGRAAVVQVYIVGPPASMLAESRAFDARH